ncbi:hypothetical protein ACLI09_10370 [Flavobacterium sp. RHBU_24]|uniref:hypothetical protein n=1 Tax=Flavobacterium sp. RHBU_24 TaxID=3391185 RepID=UPI00398531A7
MNLAQKSCIALSLISAALGFAQERSPLNGKLVSGFGDLEGVYVINRTAKTETNTTRGGYFTINVAVNDTLIFSALQFKAVDVPLTPELVAKELLLVPIEPQAHELSELIINDYSHINSESLGLVPAGQKQYTPAERKLNTASNWKMNPLGLDPIINAFSGRTKMLMQAADVEKKYDLMEKIAYIYTEEDIVSKLKIPLDYVQGFIYYIVENKYFAKAIAEKNHELARFMITGLAGKYLLLLKE